MCSSKYHPSTTISLEFQASTCPSQRPVFIGDFPKITQAWPPILRGQRVHWGRYRCKTPPPSTQTGKLQEVFQYGVKFFWSGIWSLKFRYYEEATKFEKISNLFWQNSCFYSVGSKQVADFFQIFVAFSEKLNFNTVITR